MTPAAPPKPFVLPELQHARAWPVMSTSTPGLIHMVIRGDTPGDPLEIACARCSSAPDEPCAEHLDAGPHLAPAQVPCDARRAIAARTLVTRWYCTGTQRPTTGPHCGPNCCHITAVREQLEREETT